MACVGLRGRMHAILACIGTLIVTVARLVEILT